MRRAAIAGAVLCIAGCRQLLGIEEGAVVEDASSPDTPIDIADDMGPAAHDEDSDTIGDDDDNCPATANADQLIDDTAVGVACDPRPQENGDTIALFLPFFPAGQPAMVVMSSGTFADDYVELDDGELQTLQAFRAVQVTSDITVLSYSGLNASFELSVGSVACRIQQCALAPCLIVSSGAVSAMQQISSVELDATLALTQANGEIRCSLSRPAQPPTAVVLAQNTMTNERVRVEADKSNVRIKNLTIYIAAP